MYAIRSYYEQEVLRSDLFVSGLSGVGFTELDRLEPRVQTFRFVIRRVFKPKGLDSYEVRNSYIILGGFQYYVYINPRRNLDCTQKF